MKSTKITTMMTIMTMTITTTIIIPMMIATPATAEAMWIVPTATMVIAETAEEQIDRIVPIVKMNMNILRALFQSNEITPFLYDII